MRTRPPAPFIPQGFAPRCPDRQASARFRALLCQAEGTRACGRAWVAHDPAQFLDAGRARDVHQSVCRTGLYAAATL